MVIVILLIYGATLEGAKDGIEFYMTPNFTKLGTPEVCEIIVSVLRGSWYMIFWVLTLGDGALLLKDLPQILRKLV